jgi:hypothetical protein
MSNCGSPPERLGGGREDAGLPVCERAYVRHEHPDRSRRFARVPEPSAVSAFVEAVRALSDDPRSESVERYLVASRALEDSRSRKAVPGRAAI